jgi:hypothetical protein
MNTELMTRPVNSNVAAFDENRILSALKMDARDPNVQALVLVCQRYDLDPLLKHAVLISGTLYVTRDGLLHVAHASKDFDGIQVEMLDESPTHYIARCSVWRKSMSRPLVYQGRYPKSGRMAAQYGPEMAEKVAESRALRRAFDVSLCSREELWDAGDDDSAAAERPVVFNNAAPVAVDSQPPVNDDPDTAFKTAVRQFGLRAIELGHTSVDPASPRKMKAFAILISPAHAKLSDAGWLDPATWKTLTDNLTAPVYAEVDNSEPVAEDALFTVKADAAPTHSKYDGANTPQGAL